MTRCQACCKKKSPKTHRLLKFTSILLVGILLISAVFVVDDVMHKMLLMNGPRFLDYKKKQAIHIIYFCGDTYYVDENRVYESYQNIKKYMTGFIDTVKNNF